MSTAYKHSHGYDDKHHYHWKWRICYLRSAVSDVVFWWKLYWNGSIFADDCPTIFTYCLLRFRQGLSIIKRQCKLRFAMPSHLRVLYRYLGGENSSIKNRYTRSH